MCTEHYKRRKNIKSRKMNLRSPDHARGAPTRLPPACPHPPGLSPSNPLTAAPATVPNSQLPQQAAQQAIAQALSQPSSKQASPPIPSFIPATPHSNHHPLHHMDPPTTYHTSGCRRRPIHTVSPPHSTHSQFQASFRGGSHR